MDEKDKKKEYMRKWREKNREHRKDYWKKWIAKKLKENPDYWREKHHKFTEREKIYKEKNQDKWRKYQKKYSSNNPEKIQAHRIAKKIKIPENQICQICNINKATLRHHPDYSKPLKVIFSCNKCHGRLR